MWKINDLSTISGVISELSDIHNRENMNGQFRDGVFSWLGDDTDTTDLAYWYKSAPDICIFLKPISWVS